MFSLAKSLSWLRIYTLIYETGQKHQDAGQQASGAQWDADPPIPKVRTAQDKGINVVKNKSLELAPHLICQDTSMGSLSVSQRTQEKLIAWVNLCHVGKLVSFA